MKYIFVAFLVFAGCASKPQSEPQAPPLAPATKAEVPVASSDEYVKHESRNDLFLKNFDGVNQKARGELFRKMNRDLTQVNKDLYLKTIESYKSKPAKELLRELSRDFDVVEVLGFQKTFVVCAYSREGEITACDDPACTGIEIVHKGQRNVIAERKGELPLEKCL
jgi:hypothetical protein